MGAIDRDAAIEVTWENPSYSDPLNVLAEVRDKLKALPLVQPERKAGHWIEAYDPYNCISGRCSECGWESHLCEDDVFGMDFCPNCGSRLEV